MTEAMHWDATRDPLRYDLGRVNRRMVPFGDGATEASYEIPGFDYQDKPYHVRAQWREDDGFWTAFVERHDADGRVRRMAAVTVEKGEYRDIWFVLGKLIVEMAWMRDEVSL